MKKANILLKWRSDYPQCSLKKWLSDLPVTGNNMAFDQTGSEKILKPEVKKYIFEKLVKNCLESYILVFRYLVTRRR